MPFFSLFFQMPKIITNLFYTDCWNIGFVKLTWSEVLEKQTLGDIDWWAESKWDYQADPFLLKQDDELVVWYEAFSYWDPIGCLRFRKIYQDGKLGKEEIPSLFLKGHASYPFLINIEDEYYCLPENNYCGQLILYQWVRKTKEWKALPALLNGRYVDTGIVEKQGVFYLFTTSSKSQGKLEIWYSNLLKGPYRSHPFNLSSTSVALPKTQRGGGSIYWDYKNDVGYRITQNRIDNRYGSSICIRKIIQLNKKNFIEEIDFEISPSELYNDGLHTLSVWEDKVIVDGRKKIFSIIAPIKKLTRFMRSNK